MIDLEIKKEALQVCCQSSPNELQRFTSNNHQILKIYNEKGKLYQLIQEKNKYPIGLPIEVYVTFQYSRQMNIVFLIKDPDLQYHKHFNFPLSKTEFEMIKLSNV